MKILYICTHNRCRSILSEAITNHLGGDKLIARSAGSQPVGEVHPLSVRYLQEAGIATDGLQSQSWDEFESFEPDLVITVCDSAAGETCPVYFGKSLQIHWGLADPSKLQGSETEVAQAFRQTIAEIQSRVEKLLTLDVDISDKAAFAAELAQLGARRK
ncbi:arsenate reductase ArsC [Vibrio mangrovi]|uniref:Arsenate reductase ArsC n=1 Tax=Vibrio mangrovi TaxID=474394 RepID=A0A1Y6IUB5_9VIBR|nr:arsenate reductase ArsC [Vibrio mangrovi]MDW6001366.1 arsenate reductase ArsC [Vibrio mangrovi]SMS00611.1 Protein ArsC [Vibrio mangrovi]